mmetsp:Transcript_27578/g.94163  ORF Transcript_27578/g.94163 Transcript_27578/m.94163 type:complete len:89 (-) Transcript_27578:2175-2441(-)
MTTSCSPMTYRKKILPAAQYNEHYYLIFRNESTMWVAEQEFITPPVGIASALNRLHVCSAIPTTSIFKLITRSSKATIGNLIKPFLTS